MGARSTSCRVVVRSPIGYATCAPSPRSPCAYATRPTAVRRVLSTTARSPSMAARSYSRSTSRVTAAVSGAGVANRFSSRSMSLLRGRIDGMAYTSSHWSEFATAHVGASAALLGLVFVGLTINLREVVHSRWLVNRAAEAVILLGSALATATAVLVPGQRRGGPSAELIALGAATLGILLLLQHGVRPHPPPAGKGGPPPLSLL